MSSIEIEDFAADTTTIGVLAEDAPVSGSIGFEFDDDWVQLAVEAGNIYAVEMTGISIDDFELTFYDPTGSFLDSEPAFFAPAELAFVAEQTGIYYVSASSFFETGDYEMSVFNLGPDDFSDDVDTTGILMLETTASGDIQYRNDRDWFRLEVAEGSIYDVEFQSVSLSEVDLTIRDDEGNFVESYTAFDDPTQFSFAAETAGPYFIQASSFGDTGTYELTVTDGGMDDFPANASTTGVVSAEAPVNGEIDYQFDEDWVQLSVTPGLIYTLEMEGLTLTDLLVDVFDDLGNFITGDSRVGEPISVSFVPEEGRSYFAATRGSGDTGTYTLSLTEVGEDDFASDSSTTAVLEPENPITGTIEVESDSDWFQISVTAGLIYTAELVEETLDGVLLEVFDGIGNSIDGIGEFGLPASISFIPEENGTYFVAASSFGETGTYEISLSVDGMDDFAGNTSTTGVLDLDGSISGTIEVGSDEDWFQVAVTAGAAYVVEMTGDTLIGIDLEVRDSDGSFVTGDSGFDQPALTTFVAEEDGIYFVTASSFGTTGTYDLSFSEREPDDFAGDISTTGVLTPDVPVDGQIQFDGDEDWFQFTADAGTIYTVDMTGLDTLEFYGFEILDSSGFFLTDGLSFTGPASASFLVPEDGIYFAAARGLDGLGGYQIVLSESGEDDFVDDMTTTGVLNVGAPSVGEVQFQFDEDWFRFDVTEGVIYEITMTSTSLDFNQVSVVNDTGVNIATATGFDEDAVLTFAATQDATYFVQASSGFRETESYELNAVEIGIDDFADDSSTSGIVSVGTPVSGEIQFGTDRDWFRLEVTEGVAYTVEMSTDDSDDFNVNVLDSFGFQIASGFPVDGSARTTFLATEDGEVFIETDAFGNPVTYDILVTEAVDDFANDITTAGVLSEDLPASGDIEFAGDTDWFRVSLEAGSSYTIDLKGSDSGFTLFDPELILYDADGEFITSNDDGPDGLDSQISEFTPGASGDYFVEAAPLSFGLTGTYQLELTHVSDADPMPDLEFTPENYDNRYAGTPGDDTFNGSSGSDWMEGFEGNDRLNGGAGDDYIIAGSGNDGYVRGGTGADVFQFGLGDDLIKIFDWEAGLDRIRLVDGLEFDDLTISSADFNGVTTTTFRTSEGDRLDIRGFLLEDLSSADFILGDSTNNFDPSDYDTQITHDDTDSVLNGTTGTDFIRGGGGKDNIFGDAGDDYIDAGAGNDGYVRGGAGADVFEFGLGSDAVKIFDWEDGVDLIALRGGLSFDDLQISTAEHLGVTTVSLTTASFDRLQIRDVDLEDIGVEDFILI